MERARHRKPFDSLIVLYIDPPCKDVNVHHLNKPCFCLLSLSSGSSLSLSLWLRSSFPFIFESPCVADIDGYGSSSAERCEISFSQAAALFINLSLANSGTKCLLPLRQRHTMPNKSLCAIRKPLKSLTPPPSPRVH